MHGNRPSTAGIPSGLLAGAVLVALLGWPSPARTQERAITLDQAVQLALANNLGLSAARLDTQIQTAGVAAERARFGRTLSGGTSYASDRSPSTSRLEEVPTTTSNRQALSVLAQTLATGGRLGLDFGNNRSSSNVAYLTSKTTYNSSLELSFTQPLLQGRGAVNRIALDLARHSLEGSRTDLQGQIRDLRVQVGQAYWNQFYARANLEVARQLREGAQRVLEMVRAQAEMGTGTRNSILQAEVRVAQREEEIVVAEGSLQAAEDQLKARCGLDRDPAAWQTRLALVDTPAVVPFAASLDEGIEKAQAASVEYQQARLQATNLDLQIALARDRTRPDVALAARLGLTGSGSGYQDDLQVLGQADGRSWQGGLSLSFPLGRTPEEAQFQQRLLERQRSGIALENLRLQLAQQVRDQHRQVLIARRRTEVARAAMDLAVQNVAEQEERLALGLATVKEVLDAQDELASARVSRLQAVVDYSKARLVWDRLVGQ